MRRDVHWRTPATPEERHSRLGRPRCRRDGLPRFLPAGWAAGFAVGTLSCGRDSFSTKHVVAAGLFARDAGSIPAASTTFIGCFRLFFTRRDNPPMKTKPARTKNRKNRKPLEVIKAGGVSVP